jgi:hypothetical protein
MSDKLIPLTIRSHYSLMWGTDSPAAICRAARRMGYDRLALTDTDNLYGVWKFVSACREEGLTPIVGAEITDPKKKHRAVCLVKDTAGYANLCRLITRRHRDPAFDLSTTLPDLAGGLLVLTTHAGLLAAWHRPGCTRQRPCPGVPHPLSTPWCRRLEPWTFPWWPHRAVFFSNRTNLPSTVCCGPSPGTRPFPVSVPATWHQAMPGWLRRTGIADGSTVARRPCPTPGR